MDGAFVHDFVFREVSYDEGYPLIEPHLAEHFAEVARFKDQFTINHDAEAYRALEAMGRLFTLIAYRGADVVGYSVNFMTHGLHYRDTPMAQNDLLYVQKKHRRSSIGLRLIGSTVAAAKARGAEIMMWHAKEGTALNALLPRLQYQVMDVIWAKVI